MPDGKVLVILAVGAMLVVGASKVGHGVKVGAQKTVSVVKHIVKHPVDSAKNGSMTKGK